MRSSGVEGIEMAYDILVCLISATLWFYDGTSIFAVCSHMD
jgi:hypothetical protein